MLFQRAELRCLMLLTPFAQLQEAISAECDLERRADLWVGLLLAARGMAACIMSIPA